jgi:hypothetical protein
LIPAFDLQFSHQEEHLVLPTITSIRVVQQLYDILFQYAITPEYEEKLKFFIGRMEKHIKSKPKAPFSMPLEDLKFLDEGLEEMKLLNWMQIPVSIFEIVPRGFDPADELAAEKVFNFLESIFTFNRWPESLRIAVYPSGLTRY